MANSHRFDASNSEQANAGVLFSSKETYPP